MPAIPKTSDERVISAAFTLLDRSGIEGVTMARVASRAGVRAPSLYKRFSSRSALLGAVQLRVLQDWGRTLALEAKGRTPGESLRAMGEAYRAFALRRPHSYLLLYSPEALDLPETAQARLEAVLPLFAALKEIGVAEADVLAASRTLVAYVHGYVTMEIAGAFRIAKPSPDHFAFGLEAIIGSLRRR